MARMARSSGDEIGASFLLFLLLVPLIILAWTARKIIDFEERIRGRR